MSAKSYSLIAAMVICGATFVIAQQRIVQPATKPGKPAEKQSAPAPPSPVTAEQTPTTRSKPVASTDGMEGEYIRLRSALDKKVDVEFKDAPLTEVAAWATKQAGVDVVIDNIALKDAGQATEELKVTLSRRGESVWGVLRLVLSDLDMSPVIWPGRSYVSITLTDHAFKSLIEGMYDLSDFVTRRESDGRWLDERDAVARLLASQIGAATWQEVGGAGTYRRFGNHLIVSQTPEIHEQITESLARLRALRTRTTKIAQCPIPLSAAAEAELSVADKLRQPCVLHVDGMPLSEFAKHLTTKTNIKFILDKRALADSGIELDTPVTVNVDHATLRDALQIALQAINVTYLLQGDEVLISNSDNATMVVKSYVYSVADLLPMASDAASDEEGPYDALSKLIIATVAPVTWDSVGGSGSIEEIESLEVLVVAQTFEVHEQICALLAQLRERAREIKPVARKDDVELRVYTVSSAVDAKADAATTAAIASVIRDTIAPESWKTGDVKQAYLGVLPDRLVVRAKRSVQREVRELLRTIEHVDKATP